MRFKQLFDFILYSNIWIALGAFALCLQTKYLLFNQLNVDILAIFVLFSTILLYTLHRMIGFYKIKAQPPIRFSYLSRFNPIFPFFIIPVFIISVICYFLQPNIIRWLVLIPALISFAYVLPFLKGRKRLRDLPYIKLVLIAWAWAWVTVILPVGQEYEWSRGVWLMFAERFCFIFAIAITFDIRDVIIDSNLKVKTIPANFGVQAAKGIGALMVVLMLIFAFINFRVGIYTFYDCLALFVSAIFTNLLIIFAKPGGTDYYFSGLLDSMIPLQLLLLLLF